MNKKLLGIGVIGVIAVGALVAVYLQWTREPRKATELALGTAGQAVSISRSVMTGNSSAALGGQPTLLPPPKAVSSIDYKKTFAESKNYWSYAKQILFAAKGGNADAQYYLSKVMEFCEENNASYFQLDGRNLTLDEGLQLATERKQQMQTAQSIFDRCHDFQNHNIAELGSAKNWLAKATEAGQPIAQAVTAEKIMLQNMMQSYVTAGAASTPITEGPQVGVGLDSHQLMRAAVESRDPEALFEIGWAQGLVNSPNSDQNTDRLAWMLVACQRGYDCSADADWVRFSCPNCDAGSPGNLMQSVAGNNWPAVQQRAQEINTKLDAGQWDALGLGS